MEVRNITGGAVLAGSFGLNGSTCFDDTTSRSDAWFAIQITEDAAFTALTDTLREGTAVTGITFPAGIVIYGKFTTIELASGSCIAYKE